MIWFYVLVGVVIVLMFLEKSGVFSRIQHIPKGISFPYRKKDYLLTVAERGFFDVLFPIAQQNNWHLFAKVRLEDLFWIPKGLSQHERWSWRLRIKSRHVDFLICNRENIMPMVAIELDDSTHNQSDRVSRDGFYAKLFQGTGLPLIRFKVKSSYDSQEITKMIIGGLKNGPSVF